MSRPLTFFLTLFAALLSGCATDRIPESRAAFANSTINGQPAYAWLDTGSPETVLTRSAVQRFNLSRAPLPAGTDNPHDAPRISTPVHVILGHNDLVAQLPIYTKPWYFRALFDLEKTSLIIGWPDLRDNILVFDPANHTISRADTLPPQVSTWSKLKILRTDHLLLETTLPDGSPGDILIDTGSPLGVGLAPAAWHTWLSSHPNAGFLVTPYTMPDAGFSGMWETDERWADNITLGPVTLSDLPANRSNHTETALAKNYIGTLGLYALGRLDLVLDGPAGFAYLHPHPPVPGPIFRGDWTIAPDVRFSLDTLLNRVAANKFDLGDYNGAIADCDHILQLYPENAAAYASRGAARLEAKLPGADDDFARAITLDPDNFDAFHNRGMSRIFAGNYTGTVDDFTRATAIAPNNLETATFLGVARQCAGNFTGALAAYDHATLLTRDSDMQNYLHLHSQLMQLRLSNAPSKISADWADAWLKFLAQFLDGNLSEQNLLFYVSEGSSKADRDQQCQAWYFIGMMRLLHHDPAATRAAFQKVLATHDDRLAEYILSRAELSRLPANPPASPAANKSID